MPTPAGYDASLRRQVVSWPHAMALSTYRHLPRFLRLFIVRTVAPSHTVGALCLIEHDGRLLMLGQRHRSGWTLPGGLINRGENAGTAVVREVAEETGLHVEVGLPFATVVDPGPRRVDILYWVESASAPVIQAAGEALSAEWVRPEDVGEVDVPTAQTLAEWARFRRGSGGSGLSVAHRGTVLGTL